MSQRQDNNKALKWDIDNLKKSYDMHNRGASLPVQILARKVTTITDEGQEPHQWQENFLNLELEKDQDKHRKGSV